MSRPTLADIFGNQAILFGGLPMRRVDVYAMMLEDGFAVPVADRFAFAHDATVVDGDALSLDQARSLRAEAHA